MAPLGYHAMRMKACRRAVLAFLRRWAVYLLVAAALAGAASSGGLDAVRALAAWSVLPLFRAAADGDRLVVPVVVQAALAAAIVRALRPLLWPARWAVAERALPVRPADALRSDAVLTAAVLVPLFALYAVGAQALLASDPAWLHARRATALLALGAVGVGSLLCGIAVLQALRRSGRAAGGVRLPAARLPHPAAGAASSPPSSGWTLALVLWPLWRGPARATGRGLAGGLAVLAFPVVLSLLRPAATAWCLAGYAVLAMACASRLRDVVRDDFAAIRVASRALPVPPDALRRRLDMLPLFPVLLTAPSLLAALPAAGRRAPVLVAFAVACTLAAALEARRPAAGEPTATASRWLVVVAVLVALASEAVP